MSTPAVMAVMAGFASHRVTVSFLRIVPFGRRPRAVTAVENSNLKSHVPQADFSDKFRQGVPRLLCRRSTFP